MVVADTAESDAHEQVNFRSLFFARGAAAARRYSLSPEMLQSHVVDTCVDSEWPTTAEFLDDLLLAVGCSNNRELAWNDLRDQHERALQKYFAGRMSQIDALLYVRRWLSELRHVSCCCSVEPRGLQAYAGERPLRHWLVASISRTLRRTTPDSSRPNAQAPESVGSHHLRLTADA